MVSIAVTCKYKMRARIIKASQFDFKSLENKSENRLVMSNPHTHPFGRPINILKFGEGNKVIVDNAELNKMFLHPDVKNRKVIVFSIIGAFRRGKSFFLDYCLRFLYANVSHKIF